MTDADKLVEINANDWCKLRDLYRADWPNNCLGYNTIDNYIKWHNIKSNIKLLTFYSLNNDWSDGTFLIVDRYQLFFNTLNTKYDRLKKALSLLNWSFGFKCSAFHANHHSILHEIITSKKLQIEYDNITTFYHFSQEDIEQIGDIVPPPGITLRKLDEEHALIANAVWFNQHIGSEFFLKRLARWNPNIGAFDETDKLIAWCFVVQSGSLGALQVTEDCQGKGFGTLVCKAMMKQLAELKMDITAFVYKDNAIAIKIFEKIGFKPIHDGYWLRTYPTIAYTWTLDETED